MPLSHGISSFGLAMQEIKAQSQFLQLWTQQHSMKSTPSAKSSHCMGVNIPIKVTTSIRWGKAFPRGWLMCRAATFVFTAMKYIWYVPSPAIATQYHAAPNKRTPLQSEGIKVLMAALLTQLTELNDSLGSCSWDEKKLCVTTWPHRAGDQI